uniref:Uncharacterized protein n=1 Tax=Bactrocera dorsalis TaxID=27457 RepID=A0A034VLP5_BACDO
MTTTTTLHITTLLVALCKPTKPPNKQTNRPRKTTALAFAPPNGSMPQSASGFEVFSHGSRRNSTVNVLTNTVRTTVIVVVVVVVVANTYTLNHIHTYALRIRTSVGLRSLLHTIGVSQPKDVDNEALCLMLTIIIC